MRFALIGTRMPSEEMYDFYINIAYKLARKGIEIATGDADGIDAATTYGTSLVNPSLLHIYLPDNRKVNDMPIGSHRYIYDKRKHAEWTQSVRIYHPSRGQLSPHVFALQARNYGIIMDPKPVDVVVALPTSLNKWGGTGQGMRIAMDKGIPMFNMLYEQQRNQLLEMIENV